MPDIYKYSSKHNDFNFPSRMELLPDLNMDIDPSELNEILFHGFDIQNITKYKVYDRRVEGYSVIVTGILQNGERANLVIDQIPIYFDTRVSKSNTIYEKREIVKIIKESIPNDENEHWEVIERYPGVGFFENKVYYLRYYFQNQWDRKKALKAIKSARNKYETASDIDRSLIQSNIVNYEWTFGDWSIVRNYDCHYDEERKIHILFINDPNDFEAVSRPLSAEPPKCQTPQVPIYFHIPMDIEVNGTSDALPTVHNREEKIFMLSGGVYRSDKPDKPLVSFTISHMKCMEDEYQNYMSSSKRQEFMDNDQPDWILILTENEEETLLAYADILGKIQPEFRSQFNGYSFDDPYIVTRIHQYEKLEEFVEKITIVPYPYVNFNGNVNEKFKRVLLETHIKLEAGVFDSNDNRRRLNYIGSINVDIMCAMKKLNAKDDLLSGHALRAYLDRYGLPKKIDMSIKAMNDYYKDEDGIGMLLASDYCTVDALSCHRIANKVSLFQSYLTLAHLALCTPSDSALRAGGMKVKNVIYCFGKRMDLNYSEYTIPERIEGRYPGAVVFAPVRGRYTEVPTIALDFSSLYPSIMRALWTSSETYIDVDKKPNRVAKLREKGYDVYEFNPKWNYEKKDEDNGGTIEGTIDKKVAFVRHHPDGTECRGVYPKCLEFLTNIRKMYKKKMAKAMDKVAKLEKDIEAKGETVDLMMEMFEARLEEKDYNQKQLAVKIISNTIYGQLGSERFNLYNPFIASTITLTGQKLITAASDVATGKGFKRLYGDSFTGNTPVIVRQDNNIWISRVDELIPEKDWEDREDGKQYFDCENLEIWEVNRFVKANQIIRHKTKKKIVRVNTHCGLVDVTTDHSLFKSDGTKISPDDIVVTSGLKKDNTYVEGTELLTTSFDNLLTEFKDNEKDYGITEDLAWCYGFWMAEGCARYYNYDYKKNANCRHIYRWFLDNKDLSLLEKCKAVFGLDFDTKIIPHPKNDVYRLVVKGDVKTQCLKFSDMFYNEHREKRVPMEILYSSEKVAKAFLDGFYEGDGDVKRRNTRGYEYRVISQKGHQSCLELSILIKKCGYDKVSISTVSGCNDNAFALTYNTNIIHRSSNVVKKKYTLYEEYNDFVYDFNTETGKHHCGVGNLICSNTDSCFLLPTVEMMRGATEPAEKVKICQDLAENDLLPHIHVEMRKITQRDTDVIKMELDKLLYPAIYLGKKRYAGVIYEGDKKPHDYISGLEFVKRGRSKLLVDLSKEVVAQVLDLDNNKKVKDMVLEVFKAGIDRIQREPLDYFIKKAKYRTGKEGFLSLFIERMKQYAVYDPVLYELPDPNTVFEYIITSQEHSILHNGNQRKLKTSDKMEFKHVVEQSPFLKPDYIYYIEDVIGALARFICFHDEFNDDINDNDDDVIDKKSNESAKKYLSEVLKEHMGIKKIKHTIIKRQIKRINAEHSKQYGELLEVLQQGFDRNIRDENICLFIINLCKEVPELSGIEEDNIHKQIRDEEKYIESRKGKLTGIYSRFLNDMNLGSKSEVDDVSIFNKSPKISSSTKDICNKIERLKYLNAVNTKKESVDEIMSLLLDIFK